MYTTIGKKIKGLSKGIFFVGALVSVVIGFVLALSDEELYVIIGLLVVLLGCLFAWLFSLFAYGFGELIEKVSLIERNTRNSGMLNPMTETNFDQTEDDPCLPLVFEEKQ